MCLLMLKVASVIFLERMATTICFIHALTQAFPDNVLDYFNELWCEEVDMIA